MSATVAPAWFRDGAGLPTSAPTAAAETAAERTLEIEMPRWIGYFEGGAH